MRGSSCFVPCGLPGTEGRVRSLTAGRRSDSPVGRVGAGCAATRTSINLRNPSRLSLHNRYHLDGPRNACMRAFSAFCQNRRIQSSNRTHIRYGGDDGAVDEVHIGNSRGSGPKLDERGGGHALPRSRSERGFAPPPEPADQEAGHRHVTLHGSSPHGRITGPESTLVARGAGIATRRHPATNGKASAPCTPRIRPTPQVRKLRHRTRMARSPADTACGPHRRESERLPSGERSLPLPQLPQPDSDVGGTKPSTTHEVILGPMSYGSGVQREWRNRQTPRF